MENPWASWVNGYASSGHTNVRSHNQRITRKFGARRRANIMAAEQGADSGDLLEQARIAVQQKADYVTILMGANDVCADDFSDIPTDAEFEANVREGFRKLKRGLRDGATIYTLGIIDIYKLWQLGDDLTAFGTLDCELIWETTTQGIFPCGTMLSPDNDEDDRQRTRNRIIAFNDILRRVAAEMNADDPRHYWDYSDVTFRLDYTEEDVSEFDCFHPSAEGQRRLAAATWRAGPFSGR
jgi:lysophospholipase L1-like esterase